jgi:hypothetical protein
MVTFAIACRGGPPKKPTDAAFKNKTQVDRSIYARDSVILIQELYRIMRAHEGSFTNKEYYDSTLLVLDTIMYDSSLNKIALFVEARNPTSKNQYADTKTPFYYNASCYLGKRLRNESDSFQLINIGPFFYSNFNSLNMIRRAIREGYFEELSTVLDEHRQPFYQYNLDDKRFWESKTGWRNAFE